MCKDRLTDSCLGIISADDPATKLVVTPARNVASISTSWGKLVRILGLTSCCLCGASFESFVEDTKDGLFRRLQQPSEQTYLMAVLRQALLEVSTGESEAVVWRCNLLLPSGDNCQLVVNIEPLPHTVGWTSITFAVESAAEDNKATS